MCKAGVWCWHCVCNSSVVFTALVTAVSGLGIDQNWKVTYQSGWFLTRAVIPVDAILFMLKQRGSSSPSYENLAFFPSIWFMLGSVKKSWSCGAGQLVCQSAGTRVIPVKQSKQMEGWE